MYIELEAVLEYKVKGSGNKSIMGLGHCLRDLSVFKGG